ncbi:MAG TPA: glycosyltransferase [Candidatus Dormibacteraeota bacterium]|nr:glycosyltransferase [Candidatus Dormibacteraeota bacterium]
MPEGARMDREAAERLLRERMERRQAKDFGAADALREQLHAGGWDVVDSQAGSELQAIKGPLPSVAVPRRAVTALTVVHGWLPDAERWLLSVFTHCKADFEALIVNNSGDARIAGWLQGRAAERLRHVELDPVLGFGAAVNAGIEEAAGEVIVLFDPGVELKGDAISTVVRALADDSVAVAGAYGLRAGDTMQEFAAADGPEVDAVEGYCMAFRRADALAAGGFDTRFRFYRIADIDFSFRLRDRGGRAIVLPDLPLEKHEHRLWESTEPAERERLSRRNLYRFLDRWRSRKDLLTHNSSGG